MSARRQIAPPITRVHKLFRIRTVTNAVHKLHEQKKEATDYGIAEVLASARLSKLRREKIRDRIHRRARDHLMTAAYLGLVTRTSKRPYNYSPTPTGELLHKYRFSDECPKDKLEKAVLLNSLLRCKLTNVYDLQSRKTYREFVTRPLVLILALLRHAPVHLYQIYYALTFEKSDPLLFPDNLVKILDTLSDYGSYEKGSIRRFCDDYDLDWKVRREARRSAKPLLDWCEQLGILFSCEEWNYITELGINSLDRYSVLYPVWYHSLGEQPEIKAALILTYMAAYIEGQLVSKPFIREEVPGAPSKAKIFEVLEDLQEKAPIFRKDFKSLVRIPDFTLFYDVPPGKDRKKVATLCKSFLHNVGLSGFDLSQIDLRGIATLEEMVAESTQERVLAKVGDLLNVEIPRPELFKVPFEWTVCFLLRSNSFKADKYQGQFAEYCVLPMARDNPDIVIENGFTILVECKSTGEWGAKLKLNKRVQGEISSYQQYSDEIQANSALFVYEGYYDKQEFIPPAIRILDKVAKNVAVITQSYLARSLRDNKLRKKLEEIMMNPLSFDGGERILS